MKLLTNEQLDQVTGGWRTTDAFTKSGSSYWLTGASDTGKGYEESQKKKAAREEAARRARENGTNPLVEYADLMGF